MGSEHRRERRRVPAPVLRYRLASGRGAIEQPNAVGDGAAPLTPILWLGIVLTGIASGLFGILMMSLVFGIEHIAFGFHSGGLLAGVQHSSYLRRTVSLLIAGAFGGVAWYLLRRFMPGGKSEIDDAVWGGDAKLAFGRSFGTAVISEIVIGLGASLGREAAPKLLGGASGSVIAGWTGLSVEQRRLLVSCGAGAGLAAVYNVPIGGALFTAEVLCGSITLATILPALGCSVIATLTARITLPSTPIYGGIPNYQSSAALIVWAVIAGVIIGPVAAGYVRVIGWTAFNRAKGRWLLVLPLAAFGVLGLVGIAYPQVFGNGSSIVRFAFLGQGGIGLVAVLLVLKPLVTALCLGSGASGGLFTPTLSVGSLLGLVLGLGWNELWHGVPLGAYAIVGATAMIASAMQAPLAALALILELTQGGFALLVPMMFAVVLATAGSRYLDGYSLQSARLPAS